MIKKGEKCYPLDIFERVRDHITSGQNTCIFILPEYLKIFLKLLSNCRLKGSIEKENYLPQELLQYQRKFCLKFRSLHCQWKMQYHNLHLLVLLNKGQTRSSDNRPQHTPISIWKRSSYTTGRDIDKTNSSS
jgi:hypothetical protein